MIAVEILEPKGFGRVRMKHINNAGAENLIPFVVDWVKTGSTASRIAGAAITNWKVSAINTKRQICLRGMISHMSLCREFTGLLLFSNDGCL